MKIFQYCITKLKQCFVNNGYSNKCFDKTLQKYRQQNWTAIEATPTTPAVFYKS